MNTGIPVANASSLISVYKITEDDSVAARTQDPVFLILFTIIFTVAFSYLELIR